MATPKISQTRQSTQEQRFTVVAALTDDDFYPHCWQAEQVIDAALRLLRLDIADDDSNTAAAANLLSHELHRLRSL